MANKGDLRIWWNPQVGACTTFFAPVASLSEAKRLLDTLAKYDAFQFENRIRGDYSNAGGLEGYDPEDGLFENGWSTWYDDNGDEIENLSPEKIRQLDFERE